jgi:hypothetical protein
MVAATWKSDFENEKMATRETITVEGVRQPCLNVSETVGENFGANKIGDVMLVQVMFKYIVGHFGSEQIGLSAKDEVPEPTGLFDSDTTRLIIVFQRKMAHQLIRVDGIVHPAFYKDRNLKFGDGPLPRMMTITSLHFGCVGVSPATVDYTAEITRQFPLLLPWPKK